MISTGQPENNATLRQLEVYLARLNSQYDRFRGIKARN